MASNSKSPISTFFNYPDPKLGPEVPYAREAAKNPVIRGLPLSIGSSMSFPLVHMYVFLALIYLLESRP